MSARAIDSALPDFDVDDGSSTPPHGDPVAETSLAPLEPSSDLPTLLQEWRANGGDQVRKEYEEAMAAAG